MSQAVQRLFWLSIVELSLVACTGTVSSENDRPSGAPDVKFGAGGAGAAGGNRVTPGGNGGIVVPGGPDMIVPATRFARLSHRQWENTVRDLLYLPKVPGLSSRFTGDAISGKFDNEGSALQVTDNLFADYQQAADTLASQVAGDINVLSRLKPPGFSSAPNAQARPFVEAFGRRAFRRPLATEEAESYAALFGKGNELYGSGDATTLGMRAVIEAMLQSPHFLYRMESGQPSKVVNGKMPLTSWEMAARLSYALSDTMPDGELQAAAADGKLQGALADVRSEVRKHAVRLLSGEGGKASLTQMYAQYLRLSTYDGIDKDVAKVPEFTAGIGADMRQETLHFVSEIVNQQDGSTVDLLTAPFSFVNQRLAKVYGLAGTFNDQFKKVDLDPKQRAGLLTQSGFLASNAHRAQVDSIHRGIFIRLTLMCSELPPPADNVTEVPNTGGKTNRDRVTAHTGPGTCGASCHSLINPAGFAFEKFDPIGKYRTTDNGSPADDSGTMEMDGASKTWKTGVEFIKLLSQSDEVHRCMTQAWVEYLFGRRILPGDANLVDRVARASLADRQSVKSLVLELVTSEPFLFRTSP